MDSKDPDIQERVSRCEHLPANLSFILDGSKVALLKQENGINFFDVQPYKMKPH